MANHRVRAYRSVYNRFLWYYNRVPVCSDIYIQLNRLERLCHLTRCTRIKKSLYIYIFFYSRILPNISYYNIVYAVYLRLYFNDFCVLVNPFSRLENIVENVRTLPVS